MFKTIPTRKAGRFPADDELTVTTWNHRSYTMVQPTLYEHGTIERWIQECRCDRCKRIKLETSHEDIERALRTHFPGRTHGTISTYGCGCRCEECRAEKSRANLAYNTRVRAEREAEMRRSNATSSDRTF